MDVTSSSPDEREAVLDALDRVLATWHETEGFAHAVAETMSRHGYARADVETQLRNVAKRCRGRTMRLVLVEELGPDADLTGAPRHVLVLASGRMPGLAIEGIAAALAVGATALVRPSRDETVLHHLLGGLRVSEPVLMSKIEVVGAGGGEPPWNRCDGAVVFGSDETIALVRDRLSAAAAAHIAAYGSRQAIAVVTAAADNDERSWARRLADDVLAFRQAGCMSPAWLFVLGDSETRSRLRSVVGRELALARTRHLASGIDIGHQERRSCDANVLAAIAAGLAPDHTALHAGDAQLTVIGVADIDELMAQVLPLGSLLQTAVLATGREEHAQIAERLLLESDITRICRPGQAHEPDPLWPQDGLGRVAPLLGR